MTFKQAKSTLKKFCKWRYGEIDNWDRKNRIPPPEVMDDMYRTLGQALEICERFHLNPHDISDDVDTSFSIGSEGKIIQIVPAGQPFPFINFTGKWKLNTIKEKKNGMHNKSRR